MEEVTVETCMGKAFDVVIRHQLDPVWNQLVWNRDPRRYIQHNILLLLQSSKTRQLVFDMKTLRTIL